MATTYDKINKPASAFSSALFVLALLSALGLWILNAPPLVILLFVTPIFMLVVVWITFCYFYYEKAWSLYQSLLDETN